MRIACQSVIQAVYEDLRAAVGSARFCEIIEGAFSADFVYTDPGIVLLGREAFTGALRRLRTIRSIDRLEISVRDLGSHAVVTGACALGGPSRRGPAYVFNALWRPEAGEWFCVAQRGASTLLSAVQSTHAGDRDRQRMAGITLDAGGHIALDRDDRRVIVLLARAAEPTAGSRSRRPLWPRQSDFRTGKLGWRA